MAYDPMTDGYQGRNFVLPPLSHGQGRFREDIVIGGDLDEAEEWLKGDHYFEPNIPRIRRTRPPLRVHTDPDGVPEDVDTDRPYRVGQGPVEASSCTDLMAWPRFKYDVNGYYRILGVTPWATKAELREAYRLLMLSDTHQDVMVRATYCFKQLLVPEIRQAYDSMPPGELFIDSWEMKRLRDEAKAEAVRRRMARGQDLLDTEANDEEATRVLDEQGWSLEPDEEESPDPVDRKSIRSQDPGWQYGYYRLRSTSHDRDRLGRWQSVLVSALAARKENLRLVVGFHRDSVHPWKVAQVGQLYVAFLRDTEEPSVEMADKCSELLISMNHPTPSAHSERPAPSERPAHTER